MNAKVAAWIGMVTTRVLASDLIDPVVSWSLVPTHSIRIRAHVNHARRVFFVEEVIDAFQIDAGLPYETIAAFVIGELKKGIESCAEK